MTTAPKLRLDAVGVGPAGVAVPGVVDAVGRVRLVLVEFRASCGSLAALLASPRWVEGDANVWCVLPGGGGGC
jgi:hypothetical protein